MPKGLFIEKPEVLVIEEFEAEMKDKQIRIKSEFAAIKHGTDMHVLSGATPYHAFDAKSRLFLKNTVSEVGNVEEISKKRPFGNTLVGTVIEIGNKVKNFNVGDKVYSYGQIAEEVVADEDHVEHLTPPLNASDAVCMDPAFFAFAAVRDANVKPGDNVIVSGMGAIGIFIIQLLKLNGCMEIVAVDPIKKRRDLAKQYGATAVLDPTQCDVGMESRSLLGKGADIAIEASGNYKALHEAIRSIQQCGSIVTLGFYKGKDTELVLGEEWHHNRPTLISSMPVWGNPLRDHPLWDVERLTKTVKQMFIRGMLSSKNIVDPIVEFDQVAAAIMDVYRTPSESIKLGVTYSKNA